MSSSYMQGFRPWSVRAFGSGRFVFQLSVMLQFVSDEGFLGTVSEVEADFPTFHFLFCDDRCLRASSGT